MKKKRAEFRKAFKLIDRTFGAVSTGLRDSTETLFKLQKSAIAEVIQESFDILVEQVDNIRENNEPDPALDSFREELKACAIQKDKVLEGFVNRLLNEADPPRAAKSSKLYFQQ